MARGQLRVYLGAAPGVGKTFAMLNEGRRRRARGTDVVVGFVETHARVLTEAQIADLEIVPRRLVEYRGSQFQEMDLEAILARRPQVVLIDELAHTNVPGSRHEKRWQDVEEVLASGIDVLSTVNIQHLESVNDVVERITGVVQRETLPDDVLRRADQVELVDMTPEALRRRMAHGNIYAAEKVDAALANYFRPGNLAALRELALLWLADRVEDGLQQYMDDHGITAAWETRERVVVALTGAPGGEHLIRRAARMARRTRGDLLGVHVQSTEGLAGPPSDLLVRHRQLVEELGGTYHEVADTDAAKALVTFARSEHATQLVLGSTQRSRVTELMHGSVINRVVRASGDIDVHVISTRADESERSLHARPVSIGLSFRRQLVGWLVALVTLPLLTLVLTGFREQVELPSVLLFYLLAVIVVATIGGLWPALAAALVASLLVNYFFTPPIHTFTISEAENLFALVVFLVVAVVVSALVTLTARHSVAAARSRAEAEAYVRLASAMLTEEDPSIAILDRVLSTFRLDAVAVLEQVSEDSWTVVAAVGNPVPTQPARADGTIALGDHQQLAYVGHELATEDRRLMNAFVAQLAVALQSRRLRDEAANAAALEEADELRTAMLRAVSHDLRTPLASIKAAATTLLASDLQLDAATVHQLQVTIDEEVDRLTDLVTNLLDMSRLQAGVVQLATTDVGLDEVVGRAVMSLGDRGRGVVIDVSDTLPRIKVDPTLLERAVANVVDNAISYAPPEVPVRVEAGTVGDRLLLRVVDRGPGIRSADRGRVFQPFQRLTDQSHDGGVGLGLAVARGFTEAIGAELTVEDTPGGGTTMVFHFECAP
jgi:two-component system sensor histidine kinase KdpD